MRTDRRGFLKISAAAGTAATQTAARALAAGASKPTAFTELFLDNALIEASPGAARKLNRPRKHVLNPVVYPENWFEGDYIQPYTTMYDAADKLFKMWARSGSDHSENYLDGNAGYMIYVTSPDGLRWDRPKLGVTALRGRRDHSVIFTSDMVARTVNPEALARFIAPSRPLAPQGKKAFFWSVVKHPDPPSASYSYVALAVVQDHRRGAHIAHSPDGIHWWCEESPFWQTPHDIAGFGDDCLMQLLHDGARRKWIVYRRIIPEFSERMIGSASDRERKPVDRYNRAYAFAESNDLREWTNHRFILAMDPDDPPDTELYQFSCHKFGHLWAGYMSVFHLRDQSIDIQLATSRDGIAFTRVCRGEPFIPSGPPGYCDYMAMACDQSAPVMVDDTVFLYYAALNVRHDSGPRKAGERGGVALATFKRDRFASLETGEPGSGLCRVITKPFAVNHPNLYLNASTWAEGSIRVEALTPDWKPIEGFSEPEATTIRGDALDHPVRWKSNASAGSLVGKTIRLKFHMTRARMYAMTFSDSERKLNPVDAAYRDDLRGDSNTKLI
ncbi:MAG: hypothetical protein FJW39_34510 [Acidobacteria bacterium]|nr:hypothetical protein [Acidobacteriota bacterium]